MLNKVAIGTAQLGFRYGIMNSGGQISREMFSDVLKKARAKKINTLDTAVVYGDSEKRLGEIGIPGWQVVTKLPIVPEDIPEIETWIRQKINASVCRLKLSSLYAVLLHHPSQLLDENGEKIYQVLEQMKSEGVIQKLGISVYSPSELSAISDRFRLDIVQLPFSIIDRRFMDTGCINRLKSSGTEIHARSIFLQGLLVNRSRPSRFSRWQPLWTKWEDWLEQTGQSAVQACIQFPLNQEEIDRVVVGFDSSAHFNEILSSADARYIPPPDSLRSDDPALVNPTLWS